MANDERNEGLPDIIKKIMESPEIADIITSSGVLEKREDAPAASSAQLPPDILDKLPQVMSMLSGMGIGTSTGEAKPVNESSESSSPLSGISPDLIAKLPQLMSAFSSLGGGKGSGGSSASASEKNRRALLAALRPYMSDHKKQIIDTMLSLNSITEVMTSLTGRREV